MLSLLCFLAALAFASAHNWMVSPSRVPLAATVYPCMGKRSILPHIQVSVGQEFQMEWATGHDRNVYFVLIRAEDSEYLAQHSIRSTGNLETYISEGIQLLDSSLTPMICANCKYHRTSKQANGTHSLGGSVGSHYAPGPITAGIYYRPRPTEFGSARFQYAYIASPNDRYVSYASTRYPWIKAVWRYEIQEADPGEWDFAVFHVPSNLGEGNYIMHYLWSGYYDCIDVNVINTTVAPTVPFPYGRLPVTNPLIANRVDHCIFDNPSFYVSLPKPVTGSIEEASSHCVRNCLDSYENGGCTGVTVFPLSIIRTNWGPHWNTANNTLTRFYNWAWDPNGHWNDESFGFYHGNEAFPYDYVSNNGTHDLYSGIWRVYGNNAAGYYDWLRYNPQTLTELRDFVDTGTGNSDPWVCVFMASRTPTTTSDKYTIVDDPLDPVWYSTCYEIILQLEFIGFNTTLQKTTRDIPYKYAASTGSGCINCKDRANWASDGYTPRWNIANKCTRCELVDPNPTFVLPYPAVVSTASYVSFDETGATTDNVTCTGRPPQFTTWLSYCMIPSMWSHPLYANSNANTLNWRWWDTRFRGGANYSALTAQVGWQPTRMLEWTSESLAYCGSLLSKNPLCSNVGDWRDSAPFNYGLSDGCRCLRNSPCCRKFYRVSGTTGARVVFEHTAPSPAGLDPTCTAATSLRAVNSTKCCRIVNSNDCSTAGCATAVGQGSNSRNGGAMCRGWQIPETRCCSQYAPPCNICA